MKSIFSILVTVCILSGLFADEFDKPVLKEAWRNEVLSSINWDHPGLEKAKKYFLAGDKKKASSEFVRYLRQKKQPAIIANTLKKYNAQSARDGLNYTWRRRQDHDTYPNKKIDW